MSPASEDPAEAWSALAPLLAGQPRVRLSRDGGKTYPRKHERDLTSGLPSLPAAVRIFGKDGTCQAIFLDFDSSAGLDWVEADVRTVQTWLHSCGARWIEDYSPNGGRHIYIPLAQRVSFHEARDLVEALGSRLRSLDKTPHQNIEHGCMRTPGSVHKRGGHQKLAMSLSVAYDVVRRRNSAEIWSSLTREIAAEIAAVRALRLDLATTPASPDSNGTGLTVAGTAGRMSRPMQQIATSGLYDTNRYASDSDARQGVIAGAVAAGLTLTDVDRRMKQGIWAGLAAFYARYPDRHRAAALQRDWRKAVEHLRKQPGQGQQKNNARISPTSQPNTQAPAIPSPKDVFGSAENEHRFIRTWRNALTFCETRYQDSRNGQARRMVLRALGEAAHKTSSRFIEFGDRSLAVATGLDHTTVGSHLRALRSEQDPLITLVEAGRGTHGDLYMLTVPQQGRAVVEDAGWKPGKIHALRPVFRELGLPAAFVYEALENSPTPPLTSDLVRMTRLSRTAVGEALEVLSAWNMICRGADRTWSLSPGVSLRDLAEQFGVMEAVAAQLQRYRVERLRWREWLAGRVDLGQLLPQPDEDYPWELYEGPPDEWTLTEMAYSKAG